MYRGTGTKQILYLEYISRTSRTKATKYAAGGLKLIKRGLVGVAPADSSAIRRQQWTVVQFGDGGQENSATVATMDQRSHGSAFSEHPVAQRQRWPVVVHQLRSTVRIRATFFRSFHPHAPERVQL